MKIVLLCNVRFAIKGRMEGFNLKTSLVQMLDHRFVRHPSWCQEQKNLICVETKNQNQNTI